MFHEPLTLNLFNQKAHLCDLRLYKRTFYESFKSLSIITAKNEIDNRVDSTAPESHSNGDIIV